MTTSLSYFCTLAGTQPSIVRMVVKCSAFILHSLAEIISPKTYKSNHHYSVDKEQIQLCRRSIASNAFVRGKVWIIARPGPGVNPFSRSILKLLRQARTKFVTTRCFTENSLLEEVTPKFKRVNNQLFRDGPPDAEGIERLQATGIKATMDLRW